MKTLKSPSRRLASFILKFLLLQRWKFFFFFLLSLAWSIDATLVPYILRRIIDVFTLHDADKTGAWDSLKWLLIAGASLWTFVELSFRTRDFVRARAFPQLEADIRMAMFDHVQHHSPKYFNEHFAGSLANKIGDMTTQVSLLLLNLTIFLPALVTCILSILFFFQVNAFFALILAVWIVMHLTICFAFTPKCVAYSNVHGEARSTLVGKIVDSLTNNFAVNLFFRFQFEKTRISRWQGDEQKKNVQSNMYVAWMFSFLSLLFLIGAVVLNGFMIICWMRGKISTGEIVQIFNTTWNVTLILWFAGEAIPQFFQSIGIATQALSVMEDPQDLNDSPNAADLIVKQGEITFKNVSFHYGMKKLFDNKDVHIRGGEKVGLVGYSGAGKSTFVNLILRFHSLKKGNILIDGQDIAHVTLSSLRQQVALIPQEPLLFHRSLRDNIQYGRPDASEEEIVKAAKLAHSDAFICKCPEGYNTLVGERGTKLSGGERQRIVIARAILAAPPILILDEATSALDSVTEKYIQDSLDKLMQDRTTIVIAHRLATLAKMDRILVFDQGKIVEQGSHLELLSKGGQYARMWRMQAGGFLPESPNNKK